MDIEVEEASPREASHIIGVIMGPVHGHYSRVAAETRMGKSLIARIGGRPAGSLIYYDVDGVRVVYYVAVHGWARRMGVAGALLDAAERGADSVLATIAAGNRASARFFARHGYEVVGFDEVSAGMGWESVSKVRDLACAHDDGMVAFKGGALERAIGLDSGTVESARIEVCCRAWLTEDGVARSTRVPYMKTIT